MRLVLVMVVMSLCAGGCSYINGKLGFSDDHPIEEFLEDQIEKELGIEIDLSPQSPEPPK